MSSFNLSGTPLYFKEPPPPSTFLMCCLQGEAQLFYSLDPSPVYAILFTGCVYSQPLLKIIHPPSPPPQKLCFFGGLLL